MIAFLSDVHLGTKLKQMDYLKSLDMFLKLIKEHKEPCHAIMVCGDLFDHRLNIDECKFASVFLLNLVCNFCGRNGRTHVPVHFIHGTASHDNDQYDIFLPILSKIDNVEIFYTKETCTKQLHNGMSVLYLPQIYGDFDYTPYLEDSQHYNIIIGHGPMSSTNKTPCRSAQYEITHSADQLGKISDICVFGHYHGYTEFGNNVFYNGSMLRWMYGEDETKRFIFCTDDYKLESVENPYALVYTTVEISDPEQLRQIISDDIQTPHRFIIKTNEQDLQTYHSIMTAYKKNTNLSFQVQSNDDETTPKPEDQVEESSYQDSSTADPIQSLITYIDEKYNVDVSDEIKEYESKIRKDD